MKRADITVGMDVLVSRSRDWEHGWQISRYRIVDTGLWKDRRGKLSWRTDWRQFGDTPYRVADWAYQASSPSGTGVLAIELDPKTGDEKRAQLSLLLPAQIKATWAEGQAIVAARKAKATERARVIEDDRQAAEAERTDLVARLATAGIKHTFLRYGAERREITLTFAEVRTLLDQAEVGRG